MAENPTRALEKNSAHIGEGVTFKGSISAPNLVVVDGAVEGDVTAKSIKVGPTGLIKGSIVPMRTSKAGLVTTSKSKGFFTFARQGASRAKSCAATFRLKRVQFSRLL